MTMTATTEATTTPYVILEQHATLLRDALRAGLVAASKDRMLPVLCAVKLTGLADGSLKVESTDRFRLVEAIAPRHPRTDAPVGEEWTLLLDRKDAEYLVKMLPSSARGGAVNHAEVTFVPSEGWGQPSLRVVVNYEQTVTFRGIDGDFPRVHALWPDVTAPRDGVTEIGFDPAYLADIGKLPWPKHCRHASLHLSAPNKPATFTYEARDFDEVSFRYLLMPRRLAS